jgi:transposase InsO family protein
LDRLSLKNASAFVDDLILSAQDAPQGIAMLQRLFAVIEDTGIKMNSLKCEFFAKECVVLGWKISDGTLAPPQDRINAFRRLKFPENKKQLRHLVGALQFSRSSYANLAEYLAPFTHGLRKDVTWKRTPENEQAFRRLIDYVCQKTTTQIFRYDLPIVLYTDASNDFYSGILCNQYANDDVRVCSYFSGKFTDAQRRLCISQREILAILFSLRRFRELIVGSPVRVRTDSKVASHLLKSPNVADKLLRYAEEIQSYNVTLEFVSNRINPMADLLSRDVCHNVEREVVCSIDNLCSKCRRKSEIVNAVRISDMRVNTPDAVVGDLAPSQPVEMHDLRITPNPDTANTGILPHPAASTSADVHVSYAQAEKLPARAQTESAVADSVNKSATALPVSSNTDIDDRTAVTPGLTTLPLSPSLPPLPAPPAPDVRRCTPVDLCTNGFELLALRTLDTWLAARDTSTSHRRPAKAQSPVDAAHRYTHPCTHGSGENSNEVTDIAVDNDSALPTVNAYVVTRGQKRRQHDEIGKRPVNSAFIPSTGDNCDWSLEFLRENQLKDAPIRAMLNFLENNSPISGDDIDDNAELGNLYFQREALIVQNGLLLRKFFNGKGQVEFLQLVTPKSLRPIVLQRVHCIDLAHARTLETNVKALMRVAYWSGHRADMKTYLALCMKCLESKSRRQPRLATISNTVRICGPGQKLALDIVGPLPPVNQFKYILSLMDLFTKKVWLYALKSKAAAEIAPHIVRVFIDYMPYSVIHSDNAPEFNCELMKNVYELLGVRKTNAAVYAPQTNASLERFHKDLHKGMTRSLERYQDWPSLLPYLCSVHNATPCRSTGLTPNYLTYGREIPSLTSALLHVDSLPVSTASEYAAQIARNVQEAHEIAHENLKRNAAYTKRHYNRLKKPRLYSVNERVLVYTPRPESGVAPKFSRYFRQHGCIIQKCSDMYYRVRLDSGRTMTVSVDKLIPEPPVLQTSL